MTGTIRDYVRRRQRLSEGLLTVACALGLVSLVFAVRMTRGPHPYLYVYLVAAFVGLVLSCVAMAVQMRTKCPRCGKQLVMAPPFRAQANYCPYCAVNLDEPVSQNPVS
jgi:hypothetical protein